MPGAVSRASSAATLATLATVQVADVELPWCAAAGLGDGLPVVLLAGLGWRATGCVLSGYAPPGLPVLAFDYPRRWPRRRLDSMTDLAEVYAAAVEALGYSRVRLLGVSMGGMVALQLALDRPDLVRSLTIVSSAGSGRFVDWWRLTASRAAAGFLPPESFYGMYRRWGPRLVGAASLAAPRETARLWTDPMSRRKMADLLKAIARFDLSPRLADIACPALIVHGESDALFVPAAARELAARLPAARLALIPRADHFVFLTHREWVLRELDRFWKEESP